MVRLPSPLTNTVPFGAYSENTTALWPAAPAAPVLTLLQWIVSVVLTGEVTGTDSAPCRAPAPPSVAFAAMAMLIGISLPAAAPLVTVMPSGAPLTAPTVGVTLVVPV